jgi:hypothetical protein
MTPVVLLATTTTVHLRGRAILRRARDWPKWQMVAATIAFLPWAAAVPGSTLSQAFPWLASEVGGIGVVVGAFLLPVIARLIGASGP